MILPCSHQQKIVDQVRPAADLLSNLDTWHPEVLLQHEIQPVDYKGSLVFRSAIESIRGSFIASSKVGREHLVARVLESLRQRGGIADYEGSGGSSRYDFTVVLTRAPETFAALEVKGGEGNSINISVRPRWAQEFMVWCHLDGAIVNQPSHGVRAIINRLTNELVVRGKQVDALLIKDPLCGTPTRPCPKYPGREDSVGLLAAPDIFFFPHRIPTREDPQPPVHTVEDLVLPTAILDLFGVGAADRSKHLWGVYVRLTQLDDGRLQREMEISHQGQVVGRGKGKPWRP
jgi:hypothetical protein